ncbi:adenosylcobinamide kinase/adenosylcobinamide phosphate guanyltransferase [Xenorhabdus mauleonii]|uniref:Bifunctional adenosylcobalamin biosynthesis protein n=1 Tax=Xenorhabdus mauleonii TaxID=351675 RepID=A0A1I3S0I1_9GAMM|nr:bifunctional adenosylcobinamide kinase/adenosylcobinamide-phosphate guanylyltransferase [Xenorhabdus mauleonii]PHM46361.1 adenosylcobinamide kinase/adenosylcobinamide phosphate guanyltransferase [Xenorhabdus mauleonii]SFJ51662.1 adenosylcobinamide kinase /adenosylcobinamide-phosphate guanylyltransferase [Xenorhabdus mauleonii]
MILVTGGARSGKSSYAESLITEQCEQVLYIATAQVTDEEMAARIDRHKKERPAHWRTWEGHQNLGTVIRQHRKSQEGVILECVTTLIANLMFDLSEGAPPDELDFSALEVQVHRQIDDLIDASLQCLMPVYLVTNELGMGIVPDNRLARHFVDIAGRANQKLAREAKEVWLMVSGIGVKIK